MTEEFEFRVSGVSGLMSLAEIDAELKNKLQDEIDKLENRIVEVIDMKPVNKNLPYKSLGKMTLRDVLLKFH